MLPSCRWVGAWVGWEREGSGRGAGQPDGPPLAAWVRAAGGVHACMCVRWEVEEVRGRSATSASASIPRLQCPMCWRPATAHRPAASACPVLLPCTRAGMHVITHIASMQVGACDMD